MKIEILIDHTETGYISITYADGSGYYQPLTKRNSRTELVRHCMQYGTPRLFANLRTERYTWDVKE